MLAGTYLANSLQKFLWLVLLKFVSFFFSYRYGYHITKASYFICHDQGTIQKLFGNLRNYDGKNNYPKTCGKFEISAIRDLTTGYDDSQPDKKAVSHVVYVDQLIYFVFTISTV